MYFVWYIFLDFDYFFKTNGAKLYSYLQIKIPVSALWFEYLWEETSFLNDL